MTSFYAYPFLTERREGEHRTERQNRTKRLIERLNDLRSLTGAVAVAVPVGRYEGIMDRGRPVWPGGRRMGRWKGMEGGGLFKNRKWGGGEGNRCDFKPTKSRAFGSLDKVLEKKRENSPQRLFSQLAQQE